jgi:hypothetical protein
VKCFTDELVGFAFALKIPIVMSTSVFDTLTVSGLLTKSDGGKYTYMCMCVYLYLYVHVSLYIYIYMYIMYVYIYIYNSIVMSTSLFDTLTVSGLLTKSDDGKYIFKCTSICLYTYLFICIYKPIVISTSVFDKLKVSGLLSICLYLYLHKRTYMSI